MKCEESDSQNTIRDTHCHAGVEPILSADKQFLSYPRGFHVVTINLSKKILLTASPAQPHTRRLGASG